MIRRTLFAIAISMLVASCGDLAGPAPAPDPDTGRAGDVRSDVGPEAGRTDAGEDLEDTGRPDTGPRRGACCERRGQVRFCTESTPAESPGEFHPGENRRVSPC